MATTIITKNGSGAPAAGDLVQGELAVDLTNQTLYSKDSSGNVFKVGDTGGGSSGTFTDLVATDSFTSPGIDDNANATAITIDANENVGIGTGIPQQILELASTTDPTLRISNTETALSYNDPIGGLEFYTNDASGGGTGVGSSIRAYSDANFGSNQQGLSLRFSTRPSGSGAVDTERMRIDSTGKVGIGNTNPTRDLDVGDGTSSANVGIRASSSPNILFTSSGANVGYIGTTLWNTGAGSDTELSVRSENDLTFTTGSSERMRIDDSGRVGIGNSSPSSYTGAGAPSLVIGDHTGFEGVTLASSTSGTGNIAFADSASGSEQYRGLMRYDHSEDSMQLWTNSVRRMTIDTSGKVGIGVTNPQQALHVAGGGLQIEGNISAPAAGTECALIDYFNNNMRLWSRGTATTRGTFEFIQVENDGQNQQSSMVIDSTGNVGIGKTPTESLRLEALAPTGFSVGSGFYSETTQSTITFSDSNTTAAYKVRVGSEGDELLMFAGGSEVMRIDASGNVLVGRASVSAAATDHGWQAYNTGIVYQYADAATSTDVHRWYNGAGSLVASINARGEGFFLGGATYSGPLKADEIIQDGAPVVDSLQIIRAFMKLRAATADPDSTVEELREKLKTAVDDIIDQFQDQIDNMPTPLED